MLYRDYMKKATTEEKVADILSQMTLDEKVGQLYQSGVSIVGAFEVSFEELINMMSDGRITPKEFENYMASAEEDWHEDDIRAGLISSFNGIQGADKINKLQKIAVEESRLGVPLLIGADIIHGCKTTFPIPLAESCAWDPELWEQTSAVAAEEASSMGIKWTFAPMIDIARDPRWGRISEGAGEDTLVACKFAEAKVKGFQGEDPSVPDRILACAKHYTAYGACEAGRDYNTTDMSLQKLHEVYLPPFHAAVDAGCQTIMPAFNDLSGVPCSQNPYLLKTVLRDQWGFDGMLISDANAINECVIHGASEDRRDAAKNCLSAGLDMDMGSKCYSDFVKDLIEKGELSMEVLDEAVKNILTIKFRAGLFDNPYFSDGEREKATISNPKFRPLARRSAQEAMVLLKNDGILPLSKDSKFAVAGNLADDRWETIGAWSIMGDGDGCVSVLEGIRAQVSDVPYFACVKDGALVEDEIEKLCQAADTIVAVVGETRDQTGEASSRGELGLPTVQQELLKALVDKGKKVIAVLMNGRPLTLPWENENCNAILEAWHYGTEMGTAVADILFGDFNPSGKLTATFPYAVGQCPIYYNRPNTGRPAGSSKFTSKYLDIPAEPLFPFGYGLSYTSFAYSDLKAEKSGDSLKVSVTLANTGDRDGTEVAQVYVQDVCASRVRPVKELKAWDKVSLKAGESKELSFDIPVSKLGFYDVEMNYVVEPGKFVVYAGGNSKDTLSAEIIL